MKRNSQKVFDETGYNLSNEVKNLICSLDAEPGTKLTVSPSPDLRKKLDETLYELDILKEKLSKALAENEKLKAELDALSDKDGDGEPDADEDRTE